MTRARGELPEPEEALLGIERDTPEQEAEAQRIADEKAELRRLYFVRLIENPIFREWLWHTLQGFGTFTNTFGVGPNGFPDRDGTQFAHGMKAAGWHIWEFFDDLAPEWTSVMRREARTTKP